MENLCLANGSWVDSRVVDLYPWDAGDRHVFQIYVSILRNQAPTLALATTIMAIRRFREKQFTGEPLMKSQISVLSSLLQDYFLQSRQ